MTKDEVIRAVAQKTGQKQVDVEKTYEGLVNVLTETFAKGEGHMIPGFVNFRPEVRDAYEGRNPKSGEPLTIPEKLLLKVTVSDNLLDKMNEDPKVLKGLQKKKQQAATSKK